MRVCVVLGVWALDGCRALLIPSGVCTYRANRDVDQVSTVMTPVSIVVSVSFKQGGSHAGRAAPGPWLLATLSHPAGSNAVQGRASFLTMCWFREESGAGVPMAHRRCLDHCYSWR